MKLVESSSDALIHVKNSLDQNTQAMRELLYEVMETITNNS